MVHPVVNYRVSCAVLGCPCAHGIETGFITVIHCAQCAVRFQVSNTGQRVRSTQIICSVPHSPFRKFCAVDFASRRFCGANFAFDFTLRISLRKFCARNASFVVWLLNRNQSRTLHCTHQTDYGRGKTGFAWQTKVPLAILNIYVNSTGNPWLVVHEVPNPRHDSNRSQTTDKEGPATEMDNDGRSNATSVLHAYQILLCVT
jgi:hypothetical protein